MARLSPCVLEPEMGALNISRPFPCVWEAERTMDGLFPCVLEGYRNMHRPFCLCVGSREGKG